jgi:class 3 adenylate cyclase
MEQRFAVGYAEELRPLLRSGHAAALAAWVLGFVLMVVFFPAQRVQAVAITFLAMSALALGLREVLWGRPLNIWFVVVGNAVAGLGVVHLAPTLGVHDLELGGAILVLFFATAIYRLPPVWSIAATLPYVLYAQSLLIADRGVVGSGALAAELAVLWAAELSGLLSCAISEALARTSFAQRITIERQQAALAEERAKSEKLLLNVLPGEIAARLRDNHAAIADSLDDVTILFADLVGFTTLASRLDPSRLVALLSRLFSHFDDLAEQHGLEKIKTIGDAYMAASGVPQARTDHAEAAAEMALSMIGAVERVAAEMGESLRLRVGLHSGAVVAGVIGKRKFSYDLWGDSVNTAARMESHGLPGAIQCSAQTFDRLRERYRFEDRGEIEIKGKGPMRTYLLMPRT